jgi:protein-tyrosine phosphatase
VLPHLVDRLLHGRRRAAALRQLAERRPSSVLFVCHGNQCRSPYAAAAFARAVDDVLVRVSSAGFVAPGKPAPPAALAVAQARGLSLAGHRSALLESGTVEDADLVVVMEPTQKQALVRRFARDEDVVVLGDLDPQPIRTRAIIDPQGQPPAAFAAVYARIDRCVAALVAALGEP